jgi:hypothetical protein
MAIFFYTKVNLKVAKLEQRIYGMTVVPSQCSTVYVNLKVAKLEQRIYGIL